MCLPNGAVTLAEVLGRPPAETIESADEAYLTTYGASGEGTIGRKAYSDRDPGSPGEAGPGPLST